MLTFRTSIQLPQCLKVISYLRRLDIFQENDLRLKFLQVSSCFLFQLTLVLQIQNLYSEVRFRGKKKLTCLKKIFGNFLYSYGVFP